MGPGGWSISARLEQQRRLSYFFYFSFTMLTLCVIEDNGLFAPLSLIVVANYLVLIHRDAYYIGNEHV